MASHLEEGRCPQHPCPLGPVDIRLDDAHRYWHQALESYDTFDAFRASVNSVLQALRSVTFVLQKNKALVPDFEPWYARWTEMMKQDRVMRWAVEARNHVEKEGDLATRSTARAAIVTGWSDPPYAEFGVSPLKSTPELVSEANTKDLPDLVKRRGLLRIERRWVADSLPDFEILDALAHVYGVLSLLRDDAHRQGGLAPPITIHRFNNGAEATVAASREGLNGQLPCMVANSRDRTVWRSLADGTVFIPAEESVPAITIPPEMSARYGLPQMQSDLGKPGDWIGSANAWFATARKIFETDGHHGTIAILRLPGDELDMVLLEVDEPRALLVVWRDLASRVERQSANAVMIFGEVWIAPYRPGDGIAWAEESKERREALALHAVTEGGEELSLVADIERHADTATLRPTIRTETAAGFLDPVREVWRRRKRSP